PGSFPMNRFSKLVLAGLLLALTATGAAASPPTPLPPPVVRTLPPAPRIYPPYVPRTTGTVVVFPTTRTYVPVVAVTPVRHVYTVYYRYSPYDPWLRFGSGSHNYWHALETSEFLTFIYGYESFVR